MDKQKKSRGGYRPGSGRKKKVDPRNTKSLSVTLFKTEWEELASIALTFRSNENDFFARTFSPQKVAQQILRNYLIDYRKKRDLST